MKKIKYNILWLDDELNTKLYDVLECAKEDYGDRLDITPVNDVKSFNEIFKNKKWDALILDINIKEDINDVSHESENLFPLIMDECFSSTNKVTIPTFIFTGAPVITGSDDLKKKNLFSQLKTYGFQQHPRTGNYLWDKSPKNELQDAIFEDIVSYLDTNTKSINQKNELSHTGSENTEIPLDILTYKECVERICMLLHNMRHEISPTVGFLKSRLAKQTDNFEKRSEYNLKFDAITNEIDRTVIAIDGYLNNMDIHKDAKIISIDDVIRTFVEKECDNTDGIIFEINTTNVIKNVLLDDVIFQEIVLNNLLSNAKRHGFVNLTNGKLIHISISTEKNRVFVDFSNNGAQFNGDVDKIFEKDYKFGCTGHSGEGLHLVKSYMKSINGDAVLMQDSGFPFTIRIVFNI